MGSRTSLLAADLSRSDSLIALFVFCARASAKLPVVHKFISCTSMFPAFDRSIDTIRK